MDRGDQCLSIDTKTKLSSYGIGCENLRRGLQPETINYTDYDSLRLQHHPAPWLRRVTRNSRVRRGFNGGLRVDVQTKHTKQNKTQQK